MVVLELTKNEKAILKELRKRKSSLYLKELSDRTGIPSSTLPRIIKDMEKRRLVKSQVIQVEKEKRRYVSLADGGISSFKKKKEEVLDIRDLSLSKVRAVLFEMMKNKP